jgi:hypothetical protein
MSKQKYPQATSVSTTGVKIERKRREHYSQVKNHAKQDRKRKEAYARQDAYDRLTFTQQLASCVPGGSKRQRARIEAQMAAATKPSVKIAPLTDAQKSAKIAKRAKDAVAALPVTKK